MKVKKLLLAIAIVLALCLVTQGKLETRKDSELEVKKNAGDSRKARTIPSRPLKGADPNAAFETITDPQFSVLNLIFLMAMHLAFNVMLVTSHFLLWDYSDTRNSEIFSPIRLYNVLTNPDSALTNIYVRMGHAAADIIFFALPTLLWSGEEIDDGIEDEVEDRVGISPLVGIEGNFLEGLRRFFSPNQIAIFMMLTTVELLGRTTLWNLTPYLRKSRFEKKSIPRRKKRELEFR